MAIEIKQVRSRRDLRRFIFLPEKIHANHPNWLPPLYMDEWAYFNPAKNKAFNYCDTTLLLAFSDGQLRGRVMGIINHRYNEQQIVKNVRFEHLDAFDDVDITHALLHAIEDWGCTKGMTEIVGPFGFSDKDPEGLMVEGYDELPVMVTACNLPYLPGHVERAGYTKKVDCLDYHFDVNNGFPSAYPRIFERVSKNPHYRLLEFTKTRELKPYIMPVLHLLNETYGHIYGFVPLDEQEMKELAARYLPVLDPRFVKVASDAGGKLVAFVVGLPNMTPGIQRARGRLFPFGLFHILRAAKRTKQLDLMLGAVHPEHRGKGLEVLIGWPLVLSARQAGIRTFETHLILETNQAMIAEYKRVGGVLHKRFRVYQKPLS